MRAILLLTSLVFLTTGLACGATVSLSDLDLSLVQQGWGSPGKNSSVSSSQIKIAGKAYSTGVGTHASSVILIKLDEKAEKFSAKCGVDDANGKKGSVRFHVYGNGKSLWKSRVLRGGDEAMPASVDLKGVRNLILHVSDSGDGSAFDHANWAEAGITYSGEKPAIIAAPVESKVVLTPLPAPEPRINSAAIFGVRPGSPFLYTIAASGERPMFFSAKNLPAGLLLNEKTGTISGKLTNRGTIVVTLFAKNSRSTATKELRIECGDKIGLTPPMGWNSWYCWSESINDEHMRAMAKAMKESGLADFGWTYVVIDDCWQGVRSGSNMALQPSIKFPNMPALTEYVHELGLKIGIYSTPWMGTYAGFLGGSAPNEKADYSEYAVALENRGQPTQFFGTYPGLHKQKTDRVGTVWLLDKDAAQWAEWGFDFVKLDWLLSDTTLLKPSYDAVRSAHRDIIISLSNTASLDKGDAYPKYSEMWRTSRDIHDNWASISSIGFAQPSWQKHLSPGTWPDPDMLQVGRLGRASSQNSSQHPSNLTPNEQYTQITIWSMLQAPLMLSCDISQMDDFTRGLLMNAEVLEINQDPAAKPMAVVANDSEMQTEIWAKPLADGSLAIAFFNRNEIPVTMSVSFSKLGLKTPEIVRDCWRQKNISAPNSTIEVTVGRHGCMLYRIK